MTRNRTEHQFILTAKDKTGPTVSKVGAGFRSLKDDTAALGKGIAAVATPLLAVGAAGAGALTALTVSSLRSADALGKFSDRLGVSSERLAGLRFAAEQTAGFASGQFDQALQRMTRRVSEAASGTGEAVNALKELGVDAAALSQLSPDQQFTRIADAMKDVEGRSDQVRLAFKLFDSEGVGLVNTLDQGAEGLAEYQKQADNLGIALSRYDIAKIEQANDAINRVKQQAVGLGNSIAVAVAPALTALSDAWLESTGSAGGFGEIATRAMDYVVDAVGFVADAVRGLHVVWLLLRQGVYEVSQFILGALTQIAAGAQSTINAIASITPGLDEVAFGDRMRQMYSDFAAANQGFREELSELAMMEMPSNNIVRYYQEAKEAVEQTAKATADARAEMHGANDFDPESTTTVGPTAAQLEKQLQSLYDFLATEEERIERSYQRRQDILDHSLRQQQISEERHAELSAQLREREFQEQAAKDQERRQKLRSELETVTNLFQTEEEKVNAAFDRRADILRSSLDDRLIDDQRYAELSIQLEEQRQKELNRVEKESQNERQKFLNLSFREQTAQVSGFLEENTRALAKESKTWFEINKALAATQSAVNTYEAVTKTLSAYPFPLNVGLAGVVAANGFAQVRQIMAQNFSGRSGSTSTSTSLSSAGGAASSAQQYAQPVGQSSAQNVTFNIQTSGNGDDPQAIVQVMRDYLNNDGVLFEQGSAQYQVVNG